MKKTLVKINNLDELSYPSCGYILGVKRYCTCFEKDFSVNEIEKIKNDNPDKVIFASLNRLIFNGEVQDYKDTLLLLDDLNLDGIIVSDVAALTYNLKTKIILDFFHLNNNYLTINHYVKQGVFGIFLTNDITGVEIKKIKENTRATLFKQVFGLTHLSTSARSLVSNYLDFSNVSDNDKLHLICEPKSEDYYHVIEDYFGTHILSSKVLNNLNDEIAADYLILDSYLLDKEKSKEIILEYLKNGFVSESKMKKTFDFDHGFYNKKTVYKVKDND